MKKGVIIRSVVLTTLISINFFLHAQVAIEKVLETTDVKEYNKWVRQNKARHPELKQILVDYTAEVTEQLRKHIINYYTESGELIKKEVIDDTIASVSIPITNDRIMVYNHFLNRTTVKNARGEAIFTAPNGLSYIGMGIYIESIDLDGSSGPETKIKVYNNDGQVVGVLKGMEGVDGVRLNIARDERYAVFTGICGYGSPFIFMNYKGQAVWRKEVKTGPVSVFISKDDTKIGIHHGKFVAVYTEDGSLYHEYNPFNEELALKNAFSMNGAWLVTGYGSKINYYNNKTGNLVWQNDSTLANNNDEIRFLDILGDGEKIIAICRSHNLYIFNKGGVLLKKINLELGNEFYMVPSQRKEGIVTTEKIEGLALRWFAAIVDDYLIITRGKGFPFVLSVQPLTWLIYKISDS